MSLLLRMYPGDAWAFFIGNVLVQVTVVILAARLLTRLGSRWNAAWRHSIYLVAILCVLASPVLPWAMQKTGITLVRLRPSVPMVPAAESERIPMTNVAESEPIPMTNIAESALIETPAAPKLAVGPEQVEVLEPQNPGKAPLAESRSAFSFAEIFRAITGGALVIWLLGIGWLIARWCYGLHLIAVLRRAAQPIDSAAMAELLRPVRQALGTDRLPPIATSASLDRPVMIGLVHPLVILPENVLWRLRGPELTDVLIHECAHAVCRHQVVGFLQRLAGMLFWPHPLVHLLNRELAQAREEVCDNYVLRRSDAPRYARTLLELSQLLVSASPKPAALGLFHCHWRLEDRVADLLDRRRKVMTGINRWTAAGVTATFLLIALLIAGTRLVQAEPAGTKTIEKTTEKTIEKTVEKTVERTTEKIVGGTPEEKAATPPEGHAGATPADQTSDNPQAHKAAKAKITLESLGFITTRSGPGNDEEMEELIKEKKYEFVKTFDAKNGEKQYEYRFTYPDGRQATRKFSMRLDDVTSWADYQQKQKLQREQRNERISQALTSGRFRLLNLEVMQIHLCRDVATGSTFKVQRIPRPDGTEIALPRADFGAIPPSVKETSWKEHLEAIRDGKRQLLKLETVNSYTYEMTADDGTKDIYHYGGADPLEAIIKRSANRVSSSELSTVTTSSMSAKPGTTEQVIGVRPQGNCSLSGKLVSESTGKPIAGAKMYLFYNVTFGSIFINTDNDGAFVFKNIPQGPFSLRSSRKTGYQDAVYDPEGTSGQFPQFKLKDGEQRSEIVLEAKEACRVAGEIRDENGNVPSDSQKMSVEAWSKADDRDKYSLTQGFVKADGSYVIDGLSDKPIYVMAKNWQAEKQGDGYPAIYAPSTFFRGDAKLVTFDKSRNVDGVNITLRKTGGLILEGTVRDDSGEPVPEAFVVVHHSDMLFDRVTTYSDAQGHYELQGLGDGEVLVHVDAMHRGFVRTHAPIVLDKETPKVRRDFILHRGALISGKLVDQDGKEWQIGRSNGEAAVTEDSTEPDWGHGSWSGLPNKFGVQSIGNGSGVFYIPGEGDYDRSEMVFPTRSTFVFQSVKPGHTLIRFSPQKEGKKVIKILQNGQDILESGITTKPGDEIKDVTIVVGTGTDAQAAAPGTTSKVRRLQNVDIVVGQRGAKQELDSLLDAKLGDAIAKISGVKQVSAGLVDFVSMDQTGPAPVLVEGYDADSPLMKSLDIEPGGRCLTSGDKKCMLLGERLAASLGKKVGDTLKIFDDQDYSVTGIFKGATAFESRGMVVLIEDLQQFKGRKGQVTGFAIVVEHPEDRADIPRIVREIEALGDNIKARSTAEVAN